MSVDAILTVTNQLLGLIIVAIGVFITLYPLTQKRHKVACLVLFLVVGLGVTVIGSVQSDRASRAQKTLQVELDNVRSESRRGFGDLQARLDAVVATVKSAPPNANIQALSETVTRMAAPNPPTNLMVVVQ